MWQAEQGNDQEQVFPLSDKVVALLDEAFTKVRSNNFACRASALQTTLGKILSKQFYTLNIQVVVGNAALSLTRPTENDASMMLAWNKLDYMYDVAKHCVISAAIYSDVEICHIAKVRAATPLVLRWVCKDIFWEEILHGRVAVSHRDTFVSIC
jgi:hypothetical protein